MEKSAEHSASPGVELRLIEIADDAVGWEGGF